MTPNPADAASGQPLPKLLVVDDQPANILVLFETLATNYQVIMATSGAAALEQCRQHLPDMVLLDVVMPDIDGHEVCRRLKADPATRTIPVIFVTAQSEAHHEALGLELGAVDFIVKPVNPAVVRARVKTHLAFARSRALLHATLEATADGMLVTNRLGAITGMNRRFVQIWDLPDSVETGTAHDTVLALMNARAVDGPAWRARWDAAVRHAQTPSGVETVELEGDRHLEWSATPLQVNARAGGQVFSFRDVSNRHRAERQLRQLNETLESRIHERTRALEQAVHLADAASRAKSQFLSNMSHEIRTPMNGVIGLAHLALQADPPLRQRDYLEKIQASGQHLLGIINDILDFSKIEAGMLALDETDVEIAKLFASVSVQTADAANAKGLRLGFEIDPQLNRPLRGDPLRIRQVLINFVGNAIKFTARGGVVVRALAVQAGTRDCLVRFEVDDSGIGIAEADQDRLFQPFHQADMTASRHHGGTGLGLAICKQLATLMGGEVGLRSKTGKGSTFWFTARFAWSDAAGVDTAPQPLDSAQLRGARILVVEDNPINQQVTLELLAAVGADVEVADNGLQALERLAAGPFDLVLMDVQMPVMDGLEATRRIRGTAATQALPVIAMTANTGREDRVRCFEAGMNDFLSKPVVPDSLYAVVSRWRAAPVAAAPTERLADAGSPVAPIPAPKTPDVPKTDTALIDLAVLAASVGGNPQKLRKYALLFADSTADNMAELESALAERNLPLLADLGHRLKSSARMVGALRLAELCQSLEDCRTGQTIESASAIVGQMPSMAAAVAAEIERAFA